MDSVFRREILAPRSCWLPAQLRKAFVLFRCLAVCLRSSRSDRANRSAPKAASHRATTCGFVLRIRHERWKVPIEVARCRARPAGCPCRLPSGICRVNVRPRSIGGRHHEAVRFDKLLRQRALRFYARSGRHHASGPSAKAPPRGVDHSDKNCVSASLSLSAHPFRYHHPSVEHYSKPTKLNCQIEIELCSKIVASNKPATDSRDEILKAKPEAAAGGSRRNGSH